MPSIVPAPMLPRMVMGVVVGSEPAVPRGSVGGERWALMDATKTHQPVALVFKTDNSTLPLIFGIAHAPETEHEVEFDGKRVALSGEEESELHRGEASLSLDKDGLSEIQRAYTEARTNGTSRIKGGCVEIT